MDDPAQGAALCRLQTGTRVRTYHVPITKTMRVRQIAFGEDCSMIIIGSDHDTIYVFDRRSGNIIDELRLGTNSWVQTLIVSCIQKGLIGKADTTTTGNRYRRNSDHSGGTVIGH
jgi:hypothetical protein